MKPLRSIISAALAVAALAAGAQAQPADNELDSLAGDDIFRHHLDLKEVIVTGSTGATRLRDASGAVSVITAREMYGIGATNAIDAIASLPGVAQVTTGGAISKPVIRGLGYNRIVVVNDGIRQEGQQWGDEHGIEIDGNGISSVEVLKGPASLVYGSDALAGVIKFNAMPVSAPGKMHGEVAAQYQSNNGLLGYTLNWGGNHRGNVWDIRFSDKYAHAYRNRRDGIVPNSQFAERAARLFGGINRGWGHSWLTLSFFHQTPSIVEGERDEVTGELLRPEGKVCTYSHGMPYQQIYHYKVVTDNRFRIGDAGAINALIGYQHNRRKEFEEPDMPNLYGLFFKLHTVNYNVHFAAAERNGFSYTAGVAGMWQLSRNAGDEFLIPDYHLFDFGVFATAGKRWERWSVNAGIRYDTRHLVSNPLDDDGELRFAGFKRNFGGFTASAGAVFNINSDLSIKANISRGFRTPNISELASNGVHEGTLRYERGDSNLKPEYSFQADLGLDYANSWMSLQLALFFNRVSNFIFLERVPDVIIDDLPLYSYRQGTARLMGGEFFVDFHPIHAVHLSTSLSLVDAIQLHQPRESRYLPFTPAPRWLTDLKWEITHGHENKVFNNAYVALSLDYNFRQSHYREAGNTETATPAYALLNFSAGTDLSYRGRRIATVALLVNNLTNKVYQNHLSRLKYAPINPVTGRQGVYNMGTNVVIKLSFPLFNS